VRNLYIPRALWMACAIGWAGYATMTIYHVWHIILGHRHHIADRQATPMPDYYQALLADTNIEPLPDMITEDEGFAADFMDQYIAIGDDFYAVPDDVQRFILAHEMCHYRERHNCVDMSLQGVYMPILAACILALLCLGTSPLLNTTYARHIAHGWDAYLQSVCERTLALHARGVRATIYYGVYLALYASIAYGCGIACDALHDYISIGCNQYVEYRADIDAICNTHDADAACKLFNEDTRGPSSHPDDPQRRAYIRACEENGFVQPTWYKNIHLLTTQQLCGACVYHMLTRLPHVELATA